ncbi:hypothetical protein RCL1_008899 [Eukaryota sp. TZLM3-RCL]
MFFSSSVGDLYYELFINPRPFPEIPINIIAIAGLASTLVFWKDILFERLNLNCNILCFDNLNVGRSSVISKFFSTSTETYAQSILELLDFLEWNSNIAVVSHSLGGMIAMRMAYMDLINNPCPLSRFSHLVLCCTRSNFSLPPLSFVGKSLLYSIKFGPATARQILRYGDHTTFWSSPCSYDPSLTNAEYYAKRDAMIKEECPQKFTALLAQTHAAVFHRMTDEEMKVLKESSSRYLVIAPSQDFYVSVASSDLLASQLGCDKIEIHGGHCCIEEKADDFNALLVDFLGFVLNKCE